MIKIITYFAILASLNICITTARPGFRDYFMKQKSVVRVDVKKNMVNCYGPIYGPEDFEHASAEFTRFPQNAKKAGYRRNLYTERGEEYYYFPIGINGHNGVDFAVMSGTFKDVVDVVKRPPNGKKIRCMRGWIRDGGNPIPVESPGSDGSLSEDEDAQPKAVTPAPARLKKPETAAPKQPETSAPKQPETSTPKQPETSALKQPEAAGPASIQINDDNNAMYPSSSGSSGLGGGYQYTKYSQFYDGPPSPPRSGGGFQSHDYGQPQNNQYYGGGGYGYPSYYNQDAQQDGYGYPSYYNQDMSQGQGGYSCQGGMCRFNKKI